MDTKVLPVLRENQLVDNPNFEKRFLFDLNHLSEQNLFKDTTYRNNANAVIQKYIPWNSDEISREKTQQNKKLEKLFSDIDKKKLKFSDKVDEIEKHPLFKQIDTFWMSSLDKYDHWDFFENAYFTQKFEEIQNQNILQIINFFANHATPRFKYFLNYALIRFLQNQDENREKAYNDFKHSLKLLHSQGTLLSQAVAAVGLKYAVELKKKYPVKGYDYFTSQTSEAYQRVSWGWASIFTQDFGHKYSQEIKSFMTSRSGVCAGVSEGTLGAAMFEEFLRNSHWPLEHNFEKEKQQQVDIRRQLFNVCGMNQHEFLIDRKPSAIRLNEAFASSQDKSEYNDSGSFLFKRIDVGRIPYLRRIIWGFINTIASPNFARVYEDDL